MWMYNVLTESHGVRLPQELQDRRTSAERNIELVEARIEKIEADIVDKLAAQVRSYGTVAPCRSS